MDMRKGSYRDGKIVIKMGKRSYREGKIVIKMGKRSMDRER